MNRKRQTELLFDRRRLLKAGLSSSLLAVLPTGCLRLDRGDASSLVEIVGPSPLPIEPDRTGPLPAEVFETLSGLCRFVDSGWELGTDMDDYLERLRADLGVKSGEPPSYLAEYEGAAQLVEIVGRSAASPEEAWVALLFAEIDSARPEETRLGRARRLVFGEIVTHQVALSGAFKTFGFVNYPGWFGGRFHDEASYRRGAR